MKYHVHVYQVVGLREVDVEADTEQAAMAMALVRVQEQTQRWDSPCKVLAIIPAAP